MAKPFGQSLKTAAIAEDPPTKEEIPILIQRIYIQ
jgi:hypothetical protein